jgi:hypothetical protein
VLFYFTEKSKKHIKSQYKRDFIENKHFNRKTVLGKSYNSLYYNIEIDTN